MKMQIIDLRKTVVVNHPDNPKQEQVHSYVTTLIASAVTVESIDTCKGTALYNQSLRNAGNNFTKEIERLLRKDMEIWEDASNEVPLLVDYVRQIAHKMGRMLPERMAYVLAFLLKMEADLAGCEAWLQVEVTDDVDVVKQSEQEHGTFILST